MNNLLLLLISSAGFTIFLISLYGSIEFAWANKINPDQRQKIRNVFFILVGVIAVIFHLNTNSGINLDIKSCAIAISILFGGATNGLLTTIAEGITRYYWENDGSYASELRIASIFIVCYVLNFFLVKGRRVKWQKSTVDIIYFALAAGLSDSLSLIFHPPLSSSLKLMNAFGLELFIINFIATLIFGGLLRQQDLRLEFTQSMIKMNQRLSTQLNQTIESLASAMLHRDPATENHQRRVSDIAVAIAKKLNLADEQQECIRIAGLMHDVGQIEIPAEILSRGRALSPEEFDLVKMHSEAGYSILKAIEFSCDVAEIVYQHHENIDGSGYPRGLKGKQILQGARILRVADSFEAMISHRPFRTAHDVPYALQELDSGVGRKYDEKVVWAFRMLVLENQLSMLNR